MSGRGGLLLLALAAAAPAEAEEPSVEEAKRHYGAGAVAYEKGDYATAVEEFRKAFVASHRAEILFDIARAETRLGNERDAIEYLKEYLKMMPDAPDAASVEAEVAAREKALAAAEAERRAAADAAAARKREEEARAQARRAEEAAARGSPLRKPAIALLAGGGVLVAGGIALGAVAEWEAGRVAHGAGMPVAFGGSSFASDESTGRITMAVGIALDVVGAAAAATGVVLLILSRRAPEAPRAWLAPAGRGLALGGAF